MRNGESGYGILEVMLVIAVMSLIFLMGLSLTQRLSLRAQRHQIETQVATLLTALQSYYRGHCATDWIFPFGTVPVSLQQLQHNGLINAVNMFHNPWGQAFKLQINGDKRPIQLQVKARFTQLPGNTPAHFRRLLGASGAGFEFIWTLQPQQNASSLWSTDLWPLSSHLLAFNLKLDKDNQGNACISV